MIRRALSLVILAAGLAAAPALAQEPAAPPPAPAAAPDQPPPQGQPPAPPVQPAPPPPPGDQAAPPAPPPPPVQVSPLNPLDLFSTGRETGLGADLWAGSSADIARQVIPSLADKPLSPAGVMLARRVLSTAANAPQGAGADTGLAAARARALMALGDAATVDAIMDRTPNLGADAGLSQLAAEAALITDQADKACRIGEALASGRQGVYWLRLRSWCQARAGRGAEAQLTYTLASQEGADADYRRLMAVVLNGAGDPGRASLQDGLDYALSRQLQLDLAPAVAGAPLAIAQHVGAAAAPVAAAASEADILAALRAARSLGDYAVAARAQAGAIAALVAAKAPLSAPVPLAAAALTAGDGATAAAIRASLTADVIPGAARADLAILDAALATAAGKPDPLTLDRLVELAMSGDGPDRGLAAIAAALFAPFAGPTSPAARAGIAGFDLGAEGSAGAFAALELAADAGARGDAAMLALTIAEAGGAAGPSPGARVRLERALARAGFLRMARVFAIEGLVAELSR